MLVKRLILCLAALTLILGGQQKERTVSKQEQQVMEAPLLLDFDRITEVLLERMELQSGEQVLLVAVPGSFNPLIDRLALNIKEAGADYLGALSVGDTAPASWHTDFTKEVVGGTEAHTRELLKTVDLGIMLPGATPDHLPYKMLQEQLYEDIGEGRGRTIHFHWAGAYDLKGNLLPMDQEKDLYYQEVLIKTDYQRLAASQEAFERAMRGKTIRVTTPAGTDVHFKIGERPVTKQDGNASAARAATAKNLIDREVELPAGAIRVAPIEESVTGMIAFPDALWDNQPVSGLVMTFDQGKVISFDTESGQGWVEAELSAAGPAGKSFREFALGMNPLMTIQQNGSSWIPYYGYGSGIVRLSLGDNRELGGNVGGGYVRWNFFPDASVYLDDELWVRDGKLLK